MWDEPENRRKFFENYAQANGFDPLIAKNWYSQLLDVLAEVCLSFSLIFGILFEGERGEGEDMLISHQRSKSIISYHQHSASQALIDLFPDVPLERSKFSRQSITNKIHLLFSSPLDFPRLLFFLLVHMFILDYWDDVANRKRFFEDYAVSNGFDSLQPEQWYSQPRWKIMASKV